MNKVKEAKTRIKKEQSRNTNKEQRKRPKNKEQDSAILQTHMYKSRKNTPEVKKTVNLTIPCGT
jgi:hypothetical protein